MLDQLYHFVWGIPFLVFLFCVYLYYRWNLFDECQVIYKVIAGWDARKKSSAGVMRRCLLDNLVQAAGQNNLYLIAACLMLGGAGSLFWLAVWAPLCIFLRFVQVLVLWEAGDDPVGTEPCFLQALGRNMHFAIAPALGRLYTIFIAAGGMLGLHCWGLADWIVRLGLSPQYSILLFLLLPLCLSAVLRKPWERMMKPCLAAYGVLLLLLLLFNYRLALPAAEVIVKDGFQIGNIISQMAGRGQIGAVTAGAALACCLSGLPWDDGVRRYVEAGRGANISPVTVGFWAMSEAGFEIFLLGCGAGLFLLMMDLSRITSIPETMAFLMKGGWGWAGAAGLLLLNGSAACLSWNRWLSQLEAFERRWKEGRGASSRFPIAVPAVCAAALILLLTVGGLPWTEMTLLLLFPPLALNLLVCLCLSERFRQIMLRCEKEIETPYS